MRRSRARKAEAAGARPDGTVRGRKPALATAHFPIVAVGASAGGLEACGKLLSGFPAGAGMAFILIQHLDPTRDSMLVELLARHTSMTVREATDGMRLESDQLFVIPPGNYLSVSAGVLRLSSPQAPRGARLPFDFLLRSLAKDAGPRATCVILSGMGADGSLGLRAIKEAGGHVIAQDPDEAAFGGMPQNAVLTGVVDQVLPLEKIAAALVDLDRPTGPSHAPDEPNASASSHDGLAEIIDLLRAETAHDFTLYKRGTLERRVERRMALAAIKADDMHRYLDVLRGDTVELDLLAKDLLINVTSFFRDPKVFDLLAEKIVPELVRDHALDQPLRVWVAGCSTGEETYSLAMLLREAITAQARNLKLQVFASDIDPEAVASAREGLYPHTIEADVSSARLARFFAREEHGYRILPELRAAVVFTVQDVLADPPFSRLDLVSCRNLLIYLRPEAQAKVVALFHFALREGGILLLGSAETVNSVDGRFEVIAKSARLYRSIGNSRPGETRLPVAAPDSLWPGRRRGEAPSRSRPAALAELCRRLVVEAYAPAAVLINRKHECLYSLGPIDTYLRVTPGHPAHDLLAMAREGVRIKLRAAIQQAVQTKSRALVHGGRSKRDGAPLSFDISVQPVTSDGEELLLVCFIDAPGRRLDPARQTSAGQNPRVTELEQELEASRAEVQGAIRNLEIASEEQKAINEEAVSVSEEYQATNEEMLTSKEELQSLNEELTALNSQLQEALERQRTTANDLQNVLYSTDVATIFLDTDLKIRFFTPTTKLLFSVIPGDLGRPLEDLKSLAADGDLLTDARSVIRTLAPLEREIEAQSGAWYIRRILPYRTQEQGVEGVVITFADITERRRAADALEAAERQAQLATLAKSRFLAAASHDLRQPLQTLALVQGLLAKIVEGDRAEDLIARMEDTLGAMSGMLNALLDINQIEVGAVRPEIVDFPIDNLLGRLKGEFAYHAQSQKLSFRTVPSHLWISSDPRLLEQVIRNLLSNAFKYTKRGKILLGCRRRGGALSIEVWDTGVGIPDSELRAIFDEYHQLDNPARERSRGLGLGLSIVERLGGLLGHPIDVRSTSGRGSVFAIEVPLSSAAPVTELEPSRRTGSGQPLAATHRTGVILVIEDDLEMREVLEIFLKDDGHRVKSAADGAAALELVARGTMRPDLILADYRLPGGMDGLEVTAHLRERLHRQVPSIILTGDISTDALRHIAMASCVQLNKPVALANLSQVVQRLLPPPSSAPHAATAPGSDGPLIYLVDDNDMVRNGVRSVLEDDGRVVEDYASCEEFLSAYHPGREACLLIDAYLPGMSGLALLERLNEHGPGLPAIMITGDSDLSMAVRAMRAGASDFIEKPIGRGELLASIERALEQSRDSSKLIASREDAAAHVAGLTPRQRQIMELVLAGHPSKNIAADLGVSQRTIENHRATIMKKTGTKSLPALARLAVTAAQGSPA